jgi:hypothetical protein
VRQLFWLELAFWTLLLAIDRFFVSLPTAAWPAAIGASITAGIAVINRVQSKRELALSLHKEYYSHEFAEDRLVAGQFMKRHAGHDWTLSGPYQVRDFDGTLEGYSRVLRYWHRVATLYFEGALDRSLTQRLLSREFGHWYGLVFETMERRKDMYTLKLLMAFRDQIAIGEHRDAFDEGLSEGQRRQRKVPEKKWFWQGKRWSSIRRSRDFPVGRS